MMKLMLALASVAIGATIASAAWKADDDIKKAGTHTQSGLFSGDQHFYGNVASAYNATLAAEAGDPYDCELHDAFSASATAKGTQWTKKWTWDSDCPPTNESDMSVTVEMTWHIHRDCHNGNAFTTGSVTCSAHSQVVINSAPDNAGDYTAEGVWSGQKSEGDTFSGGLSLKWDAKGPSAGLDLKWNNDPTDLFESGQLTKTNQYQQNIKNKPGSDAYKYISVSVALLSEAQAAGSGNPYYSGAGTQCYIDTFTLSQPQ